MKSGEEDWSIGCIVPVNAPGVKIINTTYAPRHMDVRAFPVSGHSHYPEGFVIFEVFFVNPIQTGTQIPFDPLDVEGIYTYRAEPAGTDAVSIDVTVYPAKSNRYVIPLTVPADPVVIGPAGGTAKRQ